MPGDARDGSKYLDQNTEPAKVYTRKHLVKLPLGYNTMAILNPKGHPSLKGQAATRAQTVCPSPRKTAAAALRVAPLLSTSSTRPTRPPLACTGFPKAKEKYHNVVGVNSHQACK